MKFKISALSNRSILFIFMLIGISYNMAIAEEECLKQAWKAYEAKDYKNSIESAEKCIDEFAPMADKQQKELEKNKAPEPPTANFTVPEKDEVDKRGLLNDVGAAYFIVGRSAEFLYKTGTDRSVDYKQKAKEAYESAKKYTYARTWDPKGWFWSPSEAASGRLQSLK